MKNFCIALATYFFNHFITHLPLYGIRHAYLKRVLGFSLGKGTSVHMGCFFTGRRIRIGAGTVINRRTYLDGRGGLTIGNNVSISPECYLVTLDHDPQSPDFVAQAKPVMIGNRAWLGARTMILPGVEIGEGCVLGAGSVVTRNQDPFTIAAGIPAKTLGLRNKNLAYSLAYFPYFDTDIQPQ